MEQNAFQQAVIAAAQQLGLTDYELYFQFVDGIGVDIFGRDEIKEFSSATEGGVCFRCIVDGKMGYASTQLLSEESAADIVLIAVGTGGNVGIGHAGSGHIGVALAASFSMRPAAIHWKPAPWLMTALSLRASWDRRSQTRR